MPLHQCSDGGQSGYKWGDSGHCYTGPDAKKKAIKQGLSYEGPEGVKKALAGNEYIKPFEIAMAIKEFLDEK